MKRYTDLNAIEGSLAPERAAADKVRRKLEGLSEAIQEARQLGVITTVRVGSVEADAHAGVNATIRLNL